jgi:hypothetical protein
MELFTHYDSLMNINFHWPMLYYLAPWQSIANVWHNEWFPNTETAMGIHNALHYKIWSSDNQTETQLSETLKDLRTGFLHIKKTNYE